jgi:2-C-methyl-D-erythritol 4-phosphate cytidylyltransferase
LAKVTALVLGAGRGTRMGGKVDKQFLKINEHPILAYTLAKFQNHPAIDNIVVVTAEKDLAYCRNEIVEKYRFSKVSHIIPGGEERQDSVLAGLLALDQETEWVAVHDGVRPLITPQTISDVLKVAFAKGAAIVGVPAKDTIKVVNPDLTVQTTPARASLWHVQTPQVFRRELLLKAYHQAAEVGWRGTDDASLVEKLGEPVSLVQGEYTNLKITTPEDLLFFQQSIKKQELAF